MQRGEEGGGDHDARRPAGDRSGLPVGTPCAARTAGRGPTESAARAVVHGIAADVPRAELRAGDVDAERAAAVSTVDSQSAGTNAAGRRPQSPVRCACQIARPSTSATGTGVTERRRNRIDQPRVRQDDREDGDAEDHLRNPDASSSPSRSGGTGASIVTRARVIGCVNADPPRVQRLPRKRPQPFGEQRVDDLRTARLAVRRIADDRPAARREVHANLMRASGLEPAAEQRQPRLRRRRRGPAARIASGSRRRPSSTPPPCADRRDRWRAADRCRRARSLTRP